MGVHESGGVNVYQQSGTRTELETLLAEYIQQLTITVTSQVEAAGLKPQTAEENKQLVISIISSAIARVIETREPWR